MVPNLGCELKPPQKTTSTMYMLQGTMLSKYVGVLHHPGSFIESGVHFPVCLSDTLKDLPALINMQPSQTSRSVRDVGHHRHREYIFSALHGHWGIEPRKNLKQFYWKIP